MNRLIILPLLLVFTMSSFAQNAYRTDSLKRALATSRGAVDSVDCLVNLAWEYKQRDSVKGLFNADLALSIARRVAYSKGESDALTAKGSILQYNQVYDRATEYYSEALRIRQTLGNPQLVAQALNNMGSVHKATGKYDLAMDEYNRSYSILDSLGELPERAKVCAHLGDICMEVGKYGMSYFYLNQSLELRRMGKDSIEIAKAIMRLGNLQETRERYEDAESLHAESLRIFESRNDTLLMASALHNLGFVYKQEKRLKEARESYNRALSLNRELKNIFNQSRNLRNLSFVLQEEGKPDSALILLNQARDLIRGKSPMQEARICTDMAEFLANKGDSAPALKLALEAGSLLSGFGDISLHVRIYSLLSALYRTEGNLTAALEYKTKELKYKTMQFENLESVSQVEYELERVKRRNENLQAENALITTRNRMTNFLLIAACIILVLLVISGIFLLRAARARRRALIATQQEEISRQKIDSLLQDQELVSMNAMLTGQEQERKRIAEDLHDRLGGLLSAIKLHFKESESILERARAENQSQMAKVNGLVDQAVKEVREISHNLVSGVLNEFGLVPALHNLATMITESKQVQFEVLEHGLEERLEYNLEISIYRTVRELVANTLKHAKADKIELQLVRHNGSLTLTYADNGIGFDTESENFRPGMGLKNIQSRIRGFSGEMIIDSGQGEGTTITIHLPI